MLTSNHLLQPIILANKNGSRRKSHFMNFVNWLIVGVSCGVLTAPSLGIVELAAFSLSGLILGVVLGFVTLPLADDSIQIVLGASVGLGAYRFQCCVLDAEPIGHLGSTCVMIGALIGATSAALKSSFILAISLFRRIQSQ